MEHLTAIFASVAAASRPLQSPLFLLGLLLVLAGVRQRPARWRWLAPIGFALLFGGSYWLATREPEINPWLYRLESPLLPALLPLALPALLLPRTRAYRIFLVLPALALLGLVIQVIINYRQLPAGTAYLGLPASPTMLMLGVVAALVLVERWLTLRTFRRVVRLTLFAVLMFGGFLLRQNATDYASMEARRAVARKDIVSFAETTPVLRDDNRLSYLPAAPCRFSADGGYVQGCVLEWGQRLLQLDPRKILAGNVEETALFAITLAAGTSLLALLFIGARAWCGWVCPLALTGDALDWVRRTCGLPHLKPAPSVKLATFASGISLTSFTLLLAAATPRLDAQGRFLGCKIPVYPFCKICPGQQVCPVASKGPAAYPPLPGFDWLGGFFLFAALLLVLFFVASFMAGRRLWCRFCPMGMVGGLFNRGGLVALKKTARRCNGCGVCREVCPMDIPTVATEMTRADVTTFDCIYCLECVAACPQQGCLHAELAGHVVTASTYPPPPRGSHHP